MMDWDAFRGVTLRALRIDYISPAVCELISSGSSGSGSGESSVLDVLPVTQLAGPTNLQVSVEGGVVTLTWVEQSYIFAYVVYAGPTADGPFVLQTSNVIGNSFSYSPGAGTYFYKVTGVEPDFGETTPSETVGPITVT